MNLDNERVFYWIELSKYDIETAQAMLDSKRFLYVGFMCHQSIEKILKGFYVSINKDNPPYTHNLGYLSKESGIYKDLSKEQKDLLDILEPLNIEARYPTHKDMLFKSLTEKKCQELIDKTRNFISWIEKRL